MRAMKPSARRSERSIFIGDAMEENPDTLAALAGELALLGVKAFMFQEGQDPAAKRTFGEIARLTGGAYSAFDAGASARLAALLRAAAAYAAGGHAALRSGGGGRSPTRGSCCRRCAESELGLVSPLAATKFGRQTPARRRAQSKAL